MSVGLHYAQLHFLSNVHLNEHTAEAEKKKAHTRFN